MPTRASLIDKNDARWTAREALRTKGQFWTPQWVAEPMVAYILRGGCPVLFDPAVGEGAFFRAAKTIASELGVEVELCGMELDAGLRARTLAEGLLESDFESVQFGDFVLHAQNKRFCGIVANPPYIRHHRLSFDYKAKLRNFAMQATGLRLDGRAGFHAYFLIRALQLLATDGKLAFIIPADTFEGVFAPGLWRWISENYRLDAVVTFGRDASPFPGVDTNAVIVLIRNSKPVEHLHWVHCTKPASQELKQWILSDFATKIGDDLEFHKRRLSEGLESGLSRPPRATQELPELTLGDFASVMRGVATGSNEFFFLTSGRAADLKLPAEFLLPAIGRTRDAPGEEITRENLQFLEHKGRPTLLLCPDGRAPEAFPVSLRRYLEKGEEMHLPERPLIATRRPWYKMETRRIPPLLFAYLGRRDARFIQNKAGVIPLTGFLCVYPHSQDKENIRMLWEVLRHPLTIENLRLVGKSYGDGAIKVEPRALEKLPLPASVTHSVGLILQKVHGQLPLYTST